MRTHSLRSLKTFVRDECGVYHTVSICVCGGEGVLNTRQEGVEG